MNTAKSLGSKWNLSTGLYKVDNQLNHWIVHNGAFLVYFRIDDMIKLAPEEKAGGKSYSEAVRAGELDG